MKKLVLSLLIVASALAFGADNEIFVEQAGATANIDLEQLGSGNIIGGADASSPVPLLRALLVLHFSVHLLSFGGV